LRNTAYYTRKSPRLERSPAVNYAEYMGEYAIAPVYDIVLYPFVHSLRLKLLDICIQQNYSSILDVCCGTGRQLKMLRKHGFHVQGVDLSREMLKVSKKGPHAPHCVNEDATDMSFGADSFEAAMTTFALHEKPAPIAGAIVKEMIRVVKPEGHLLLTDFNFTTRSSKVSRGIIRMIEWNAGGEHYKNFREFIAFGGVPKLIEGLPLEHIETIDAGMNSIAIFKYKVLKNQ